MLNDLQRRSSDPSHPTSPLEHKHLKLVDSFYESDSSRDKIRVTRDEKSGTVVEVVKKVRLGDLNIYSPKRPADWRVSVNLEMPGNFLLLALHLQSLMHHHSTPSCRDTDTDEKEG